MKINLIDGQITDNFNISEMCCYDGKNSLLLNANVIAHAKRLQKFRTWYNRVMVVGSWYRTPEYNATLDGASPQSQHINGIATDFYLPDKFYNYSAQRKEQFLQNIKAKWTQLCKDDGLGGGIGFYDDFIHLDSRPGITLASWDKRTKKAS